MKVGLFFGSFNPIHVGHLILADHFAQHSDLDQVWLVVSPSNPLKKKSTLLADHHRLAMTRIAVEDNPRLQVSNIEFELEQPSYTLNTLLHLSEQYPDHEFSLIMGEDNLRSFHKWKNCEVIADNYKIHVYPRLRTEGEEQEAIIESRIEQWLNHDNFKLLKAPIIQISATTIRNMIKAGEDPAYLLSDPVYKYCREMHFYEK